MDLKETVWDGADWTHLVQDRGHRRDHVNAVMNLRVTYKEGNFLTG
jgi:hypothetical protein